MLRQVDRALPVGTTVDSATRFLRASGVEVEVYPASDAARSFPRDTLLAGGPVVLAVQREAAGGFYTWDGYVTLYFTPGSRLARRAAHMSARNPL